MVNYCFGVQYIQGGLELAKENTNSNEHDEFYKLACVSPEHIGIQCSPLDSGDPNIQMVSMETHDPANMFKEFAISNHLWAIKFREFAKNAFAIDLRSSATIKWNIVH
jgi:hypothetical protein